MARRLETVELSTIVSLAKRRGFVFPSSEIYGGINATWDYGPLGVELKRNVKEQWWRSMVRLRSDVVGLDAAILMHPRVWEASGHIEHFTDPLVECRACHHRFRADQVADPKRCPDCGGELTEPRQFNLMFKTFMGPVEDAASQIFLRPETAQGIFVNWENVRTAARLKLPFGIAQIGKSFRNEITPGNFVFRTREFEQMEMEFFVKPGTDEQWYEHWIEERFNWYTRLGMRPDRLRKRAHEAAELAHYSKGTTDIEYNFPWGWGELEGIANRTDFDTRRHSEFSGKDLRYFDEETKKKYYPYVVEPAAGCDRSAFAFMLDAYDEESDKDETRVVLHLHPDLAPIKVAVLPLSRNEKLRPTAEKVAGLLRPHWMVQYDDAQSIGRRYRRQDEIGTPYCVTVDFQTVEQDQAVTIRDRESMAQVRVPIESLAAALRDVFHKGWEAAARGMQAVGRG